LSLSIQVQVDNLDNGQWSDLFAYADNVNSNNSNDVNVVVINADQDYYNVSRQIELQANRKFLDRGNPSYIASQNLAVDFFNISVSKKSRQTSSGILGAAIDIEQYLQGAEISNFRQTRGLIKISAGTPGHLVQPNAFGVNETYSLTDNNYFQELNLFNPIEFINLQSKNVLIEQVITFPIVTSDTNQRENFILNGVIEPFPIRSVISFFSINFPFESHGISANLSSGNSKLRTISDQVSSVQEFDPSRSNRIVFLDSADQFTVSNDEGSVTVEVGPELSYMSTDENHVSPFVDIFYPRGDVLQSTRAYETDLLSAVNSMMPQGATYLSSKEVSGRTGFMYDNTIQGVDSIAYGGLIRR